MSSDVRLSSPQRALIVSGPNGGGKTVAITAVGISSLMLRAGLPIPASEGSRLPFYQEVRAAVDERGDLSRDLSTFTAHLTAVREMSAGAGPGSLVLVDEIAADTDPREGATLAASILEDLVEHGAEVLVTTHLDELKALALSDNRFANARVGFDPERLAPTYQLHLGAPGSSSAIEVAKRVGLSERVIERARASLSGHGGALGTALRALEEERARFEQERRALEQEREAARAVVEEARQRELAARRAEREAAARIAEDMVEELEAARSEVAALLKRLQSAPTVKQAGEAAAQLDAWASTLEQSARVAESQAKSVEEAAPNAPIVCGSRVRIASLGHEGEVLEIGDGEALVRTGALKVRRPLSDLLPLRGQASAAPVLARGKKERLEAAASARADTLLHPDRRLDARGLRVDELIREVDGFLDRLYGAGEPECLILHGYGTGALKQALRDHLSASPYVGAFRPGDRHEGGDAVTIVTMRR